MKSKHSKKTHLNFLEKSKADAYPSTWIELSASAFNHNVTQYKKVIGSRKLGAVVKANAYGHGILEIGKLAQKNPLIDLLCMATATEALTLKNSGISKPLLILSFIDVDPTLLMDKNIELSVGDRQTIQQLNEIGTAHNYMFPVHLKVDTGLSRFGVMPQEVLFYLRLINQSPGLSLQGMYSHCAESPNQDQTFTLSQRDLFKQVVDECRSEGTHIPSIHLANSAATTSLDLDFCNLFRVGLGLYGLWSSMANKEITQNRFPGFDLIPMLTWKTKIASVRTVKKGSFIGYERTYQAPHDMKIAMIPVGYFDGYDFRLYNKALVRIKNQYAPIVGRIAMNVTCIDVTAIANINVSDELILMGPYPHLHPYQLGQLIRNANIREMTTKINSGIKRHLIA